MRDAANATVATTTAKLMRELDETECKRRNALSYTTPGFSLHMGDVGTVLETLGDREAFLVEFSSNGQAQKRECEWLGVLYPAEVEVVETQPSSGGGTHPS
jgi:hypothetical protein